ASAARREAGGNDNYAGVRTSTGNLARSPLPSRSFSLIPRQERHRVLEAEIQQYATLAFVGAEADGKRQPGNDLKTVREVGRPAHARREGDAGAALTTAAAGE